MFPANLTIADFDRTRGTITLVTQRASHEMGPN